MKTYILADNQELTRYALESLIRQDDSNTVVRASGRQALTDRLKACEDAIVVLDYTKFDFPDENALLVACERFSMSSWLLISDELTPKFLRKVMYSAPTVSVLFKDSPVREVREALHTIASGKRYICQRAMEEILEQQHETEEPDILTSTEMEIIKAITRGMSTKEIAAERFSSVHTITTHRKNIFRKLKVNTAHEAIRYALRMGWVDASEFYI